MAWTTPSTAVAGSTALTAAFWNEQVRDNTADLRSYQNRYATARRTTGTVSNSGTAWGDFNTSLDLTLGASAGDVIEVALSCVWVNEALEGYFDVVTVVGGSPVNSFATGGAISASVSGIRAWFGINGAYSNAGGSFFYTLVSGDISGGNVLLRLRRRNDGAGAKQVFATADIPFVWFARNLGPVTT